MENSIYSSSKLSKPSWFINGTNPSPSVTIASSTDPTLQVPNPKFDIWFRKDQMLHSWLLSSLTEEIYPYVIGLTSSFAVWEALANAFGSVSQNRQLQLHIELQELKKFDLSVSSYLQKAKALSDELSAAGRSISPAEFNAIIYLNIGPEFHGLIAALNLRPEPVTFNELHGKLVAHEILIKNAMEPVANMVLKGNSPLLPTPQYRPQYTPPPNNNSNNNQPHPSNNSNKNRNHGPCQICDLNNHSNVTCQKRYIPRNFGQSPHQHNYDAPPMANYSVVAPSSPNMQPIT
ncbi:hypothetical protein P3S67_026540 [Capsicum chacoense]